MNTTNKNAITFIIFIGVAILFSDVVYEPVRVYSSGRIFILIAVTGVHRVNAFFRINNTTVRTMLHLNHFVSRPETKK